MIIFIWLVVLTILKNISQWKGLSHILWKIKNVPNHQPVIVIVPSKIPSQNPGPLRPNKARGGAGADVGCAVYSLFQAACLDGDSGFDHDADDFSSEDDDY